MASDDKPVKLSGWKTDMERTLWWASGVYRDAVRAWRRDAAAETVEWAYRSAWKRWRGGALGGHDETDKHAHDLANLAARVAATAERLRGGK